MFDIIEETDDYIIIVDIEGTIRKINKISVDNNDALS